MRESREFYISDDGIRLHAKLDLPEGICSADCRENGQKLPLVILIHGFTGHMEEDHILALQKEMNEIGFAVLRAEMYGHGKSDGRFCDHTLFKWMSNALAVVDYARTLDFVSDLYLCGHSQGGLLTMLTGAMERDRIKAILPLSPASMIPQIAREGELLGIPFDPENIPAQLDGGDGVIIRENYIRIARMIDVDLAISMYKGPVLLVHGTGDESVPYHYSEEIAKKYANARLVSVLGDTHCYDYHLDQVVKAVRDFLLEVSGR